MEPDNHWWTQIPGPQKTLEGVSSALADGSTVWLPAELPWAEAFRALVKMRVGEISSRVNIEFVDLCTCAEDWPEAELVFRFDESARRNYLPAMDLTQYVQREGILKDTVIWLSGLTPGKEGKWLALSKALARQHGLRIVCEGVADGQLGRGVVTCRRSECFTGFDTLLFVMTLLPGKRQNDSVKLYASRLACELAEGEPERAAALIGAEDRLVADPLLCCRETGGGNEAGLAGTVRSVQMASLYPQIEKERTAMVAALSERLAELVPFSDDYDSTISRPDDMELRHLVHLEGQGKLALSREEHQKLHFLYQMRNLVSHRQVVPGEDVLRLLGGGN